ncbi:hypothetical protein GALMADRAFT_219022 [Galerina marginata CBS 339.88]|uniref:DUF6697 domain-containing protein n=1 Tax=Galerina marginata (strain CBS 339.88) TaxID=685588 RepID=A0A067U130_GALM3|nr:hypothetical protein GALMADRAFT_219022 [Galerina marginata CBS 339.88]
MPATTGTSKSSFTKQPVDDEDLSVISKVRAELAACLEENAQLKASLSALEEELKDTQATLGRYVVTSNRQGQSIFSRPSSRSEQALKRVRSPSVEIVEAPESPRKKLHLQTIPMTPPKAIISVSESLKIKTSPSEMKPKIKAEIHDGFIPNSKVKAEIASDGLQFEANSASIYSSASSVTERGFSPTEDKPKSRIKIKIKDDAIALLDATARRYLQSASFLKITPSPMNLEVPRKFLRLAYGGCDQQFLQYIQFTENKKGTSGLVKKRIVFPQLNLNPVMPTRPGEPGLIFASRHEILSNPPWSLFCKLSNGSPAVWLYLGDYESVLCGKMTAAQFQSQTLVVQKKWAELILTGKSFDCYVSMRSRIALRKAGAIPLEDKDVEEDIINAEMAAFRANGGLPVTEEDVIAAFSQGEEAIDIIRMTCVKYDHVFANRMKADYANYDTMLADEKREKSAKEKGKGRAKSNPKRQSRKPKTPTRSQPDYPEAEDESQSDVPLPADSDEEYMAPTRGVAGPSASANERPRTRSRPSLAVANFFDLPTTDDEDD